MTGASSPSAPLLYNGGTRQRRVGDQKFGQLTASFVVAQRER